MGNLKLYLSPKEKDQCVPICNFLARSSIGNISCVSQDPFSRKPCCVKFSEVLSNHVYLQ